MFGRSKERKAAHKVGTDFIDNYSAELNRGFAALGHRPDVEDLWQCHRRAITVADGRLMAVAPDVPEELLVTFEEMALQGMLPEILPGMGVADAQPFLLRMVKSAVDAHEAHDINMTTPYALELAAHFGVGPAFSD